MTKLLTNILVEEKVPFHIRVIGTFFIILSGSMLYLDKLLALLEINSMETFGYSNFSNFIWAFTQSISPILMLLGFYLKPYRFSFLIPIYCYGLQLIWIFSSEHSDDFLSHIFAIGICFIFVITVFLIKRIIKLFEYRKNKDEEFISEAKDVLEILKSRMLEESKI